MRTIYRSCIRRDFITTLHRDKNIDSITKVGYILLNYMLDAMNSTKSFIFTDTWGYLDPKTNKINGMLGALLYREADIGSKLIFLQIAVCEIV